MDLRALADFVLVADNGGFAPAARRSGESKATLSRRVRELESQLGVRLFDRDTRALRLTDEGELLYARARGPLTEVAEAERTVRASGDRPQGLLRISAPVLFSSVALGAIAASYLRVNPAVQLDLVSEDRMASAIEDGLDIIIRINPKPSEELVGRCFLQERLQIVAVADLAARVAASGREEVWPSVILRGREEKVWYLSDGPEDREIRHEPIIRTSSMLTIYQAAVGGAGVAKLPWFMVAQDVAEGRLVRFGEDDQSEVAVWALHPSRRLASRKVTSFLDHLSGSFPKGRWPIDPHIGRLPSFPVGGTSAGAAGEGGPSRI